jgi:PhzF family phenazine biosynthesis protein
MKFCTVDTFTEKVFYGNSAAVCVVDSFPNQSLMQSIALEVNISTTAFVMQTNSNHFCIKWFGPLGELKLCGHGTLAAAHVIWQELKLSCIANTIYFDSNSGILPVHNTKDGIMLNLPAFEVFAVSTPQNLLEALAITPVFVGKSSTNKIIVELRSVEEVQNLAPDMILLEQIDCEGIIVTSEASFDKGVNFVSRYFNPKNGIPEDFASGSAHCCLGTYWYARSGKKNFIAKQLSKRGGILQLEYAPDRMLITGKAVTAFSGKFLGVQRKLTVN